MKNLPKIAATLAIVALTSAPLYAAQSGGFVDPASQQQGYQQGGFVGPDGSAITAAQASGMNDKSWATVTGHIEKRIGDDKYLFRDDSGNLVVEIDHKRWLGQTVSPQDKVQLSGKIDKDFNSVELDVKQVKKLQN